MSHANNSGFTAAALTLSDDFSAISSQSDTLMVGQITLSAEVKTEAWPE
jgi:hypothetical protein